MSEDFYIQKLYPLQDRVLYSIDMLNTPFYLTGGTALSRVYLHHRYTDDLDFFQNESSSFNDDLNLIQKKLSENFSLTIQRTSDRFRRFFIDHEGIKLKLEFVNDVPFHFGQLKSAKIYAKIDDIQNILSNKITAIMDRDEPKDFADSLLNIINQPRRHL